MKTLAAFMLSLFLISRPTLADTPKDADANAPAPAKAAKPAKAWSKAARNAEKSNAEVAAELEELRQALQSQQEQLQLLKEELAKRDRQIEKAQEAAVAANARAAEASTKAIEASSNAIEAARRSAEVKTATASLDSTVSALKTSNETLVTTMAKEQADSQKAEETGPATIRYKGINITPGGFVAAETVTRQRAVSGTINTPFNSIPYPGNSLSKVSENSLTARQSRLSLLGESKVGSAKLTGYWEADWLGTGVTSNDRQSNSYVFRQRVIYGQVATDSGWSFTGGQQWTLATENRKGIQNRQEWIPLTIDSQYSVGYTWARQYGFRVVKNFGSIAAVGLSVEAPQATIGGRGFSTRTNTTALGAVSTTTNTFIDAPGSGGGLLNFVDTSGYTANKAPDIIAKLAVDPSFGHFEVLGILSTFRNRIYPCGVVGTNAGNTPAPATPTVVNCPVTATPIVSSQGAFNDTNVVGGAGVSALFPVLHKKLDINFKGMAGDGIGRYGSAQLADLTFRPDGTTAFLRTAHGIGALEFHATPKLDVYAYYGAEYAWRAAYTGYTIINITNTPAIPASGTNPNNIPATSNTTISTTGIGGYGSPFANNSGCSTENAPSSNIAPSGGGTCAGDTRVIMEGTLGFWHKFYQGPKGGFRWGIQYSYFTRSGWSGNNNVATAAGISPKAVDNMVWTSFRYYIP
jgi:hypothetical protein